MPLRWNSPRARKLRTSGLLYAGAVLFEGLQVAERLGAHWRHLEQYGECFVPILSARKVQRLRSDFLKPLRDGFTFHFSSKVPADVLPKSNADEPITFLSAKEENSGGTYYDLADALALQFLFGEGTESEVQPRMESFMLGTTDLFKRFTIASQRLLPAAFRELGVRRLPG